LCNQNVDTDLIHLIRGCSYSLSDLWFKFKSSSKYDRQSADLCPVTVATGCIKSLLLYFLSQWFLKWQKTDWVQCRCVISSKLFFHVSAMEAKDISLLLEFMNSICRYCRWVIKTSVV